MTIARETIELLKKRGAADVRLVMGGIIPEEDRQPLLSIGVTMARSPAVRPESVTVRLGVAFVSAPAKIKAPGAEGRRLRRLTHGDTRGLNGSEA